MSTTLPCDPVHGAGLFVLLDPTPTLTIDTSLPPHLAAAELLHELEHARGKVAGKEAQGIKRAVTMGMPSAVPLGMPSPLLGMPHAALGMPAPLHVARKPLPATNKTGTNAPRPALLRSTPPRPRSQTPTPLHVSTARL